MNFLKVVITGGKMLWEMGNEMLPETSQPLEVSAKD